MIEYAKLIHTALRTDSTWVVVLALALVGALFFGFLGYLVNAAYLSGLPRIRVDMTTLNVSDPGPPYAGRGALVVVEAIVSNTGSQSAVGDWNMYVNFPDGEIIKALPIATDTQLELTGQEYRLFRGEDALYKKAINPIGPGQLVPGFLAFLVPGKPASAVLHRPWRFA